MELYKHHVKKICNLREEGLSYSEIAKRTNISKSTVYDIVSKSCKNSNKIKINLENTKKEIKDILSLNEKLTKEIKRLQEKEVEYKKEILKNRYLYEKEKINSYRSEGKDFKYSIEHAKNALIKQINLGEYCICRQRDRFCNRKKKESDIIICNEHLEQLSRTIEDVLNREEFVYKILKIE